MASKRRKALPAKTRVYDGTIVCVLCGGDDAESRPRIEGSPHLCLDCYRTHFIGSVVSELGAQGLAWLLNGKAKPEL